MASLNRCQFIGRVGDDPEIRDAAGNAVANFSVAVSETYKDRNGDRQETTEWVRCCAWGKLADVARDFVKKGRLVYVDGKLRTRQYQDRDGNKRWSTQVNLDTLQLLDRKDTGASDYNRDGGYRRDDTGYGQRYERPAPAPARRDDPEAVYGPGARRPAPPPMRPAPEFDPDDLPF